MTWDENKYDEFAKRMEKIYPEMFGEPYGGFAIGAGWWPILEALCSQIDSYTKWRNNTRVSLLKDNPHDHAIPELVPPVVVQQIKEKFGGLRFYYEGGDEYIRGLVSMAESWAGHSCEECGSPGQRRTGGWVRTLCDLHEERRQEDLRRREMQNSGLEE